MNKIEPNKFYGIEDIISEEMFPWAKSRSSATRFIKSDMKNDNILQTIIKKGQTAEGTRYFIKGSNIITLLAKFDDGSLFGEKK